MCTRASGQPSSRSKHLSDGPMEAYTISRDSVDTEQKPGKEGMTAVTSGGETVQTLRDSRVWKPSRSAHVAVSATQVHCEPPSHRSLDALQKNGTKEARSHRGTLFSPLSICTILTFKSQYCFIVKDHDKTFNPVTSGQNVSDMTPMLARRCCTNMEDMKAERAGGEQPILAHLGERETNAHPLGNTGVVLPRRCTHLG